ncbi:heavy metal translocating P-type ATPase [Paenibacillus sp. J5C_2022]|uniref:heavy metal translocating P-type ATPase n=1 Tax=Paenibacillus sp. J5C2022 TaxID=2977129 RepID=UPI0021CE9350|nr:heavy metal translocating P-type ATPase [Paenibacillus sp. J5C2022]MCU6707210.1 heavy metal translocating P-type ATPase [Paenibacillus sp. J5C2022]
MTVNPNMMMGEIAELEFHLQGMHCSACASRVEKSLSRMDGVSEVAVSFPLRTAWAQVETDKVSLQAMKDAVAKLGFTATMNQSPYISLQQERKLMLLRLLPAILLSLPLLAGMLHHMAGLERIAAMLPSWIADPYVQLTLATVIQFGIGLPFYIGAYHAVKQRSANMDVLVVIGTSAAYLYSHYAVLNGLGGPYYFETSAVVITAVLLGKYLETTASLRSQVQSDGFGSLQSTYATVERAGERNRIRTEYVRTGDTVWVGDMEMIPVDGTVLQGDALVNESMLTGESRPVHKSPGDSLWAGTTLDSGRLKIRTTSAGHATLLNRIRELVMEGQRSKSTLQGQVDAVAGWFVPMMLCFAAATFLLWGLLLQPGGWSHAMMCAIAVVLTACPCALGLAAPISLVIASGRLAKSGVIVKDAAAIERLAGIDTIVFDKTGTLTEGRSSVSELYACADSTMSVLRLAAAVEAKSEHPLAVAVREAAMKKGIVVPEAESLTYRSGYGAEGTLQGERIALGNLRLLREKGWKIGKEAERSAEQWERSGATVLYAIRGEECIGIIGFADSIRAEAPRVVEALKKLSVRPVMATGDHAAPAATIAANAGIVEVRAGMLPEHKQRMIEQLRQEGGKIAMVGDGWNDAPALAAADVGIAMGSGTEGALGAGHVTLMFSRLKSIPEAIAISRRTLRNIRQNLLFAFLYNVLIIPFAAIGWLAPWMAGTAMALSSVSVVANALLLGRRLNADSREASRR